MEKTEIRMIKKHLKQTAAFCLTACLMMAGTLPAAAADTSQSYTFGVSVNGEDHTAVEPGETLDLVLSLSRDDADGPMTIYAMSAVLRFNSDLMELEDMQTGTGISSTVTERSGSLEGWSDITLNYLAPSMDGAEWENGCALLTLKLKAARYGSSMIQLRRGSVSTYSGMESYATTLGSAIVSVQKEPEEPVQPQPTEPTTPAGPEQPGTPLNPSGPDTPSVPGGSTTPSSPTQPGGSSTPTGPEQQDPSSTPTGPDQPSTPADPSESGQPSEPAPESRSFADVAPDAWYAGAVRYVVDKGYFNGTSDIEFSPDWTMTRAMFVTALGRAAGIDTAAYPDASFIDVPSGQWYSAGVRWASENGIVTGYDPEHFGPEDPVTREQMAAILYRYAQFSGKDVTAADGSRFRGFSDADQVADYAKVPMTWATGRGLINGMGDATLAPQGTATRAQVAQIIMNYDQLIAEST